MSESLIPLPSIELNLENPDECFEIEPEIEKICGLVVGRFRNWEIKHSDYDVACYLLTYGCVPKFRYICYRKVGDSFEGLISFKESKANKALVRDMFPFTVYPNVDSIPYLQWIQCCPDYIEVGSKPCYSLSEKSKRGALATQDMWRKYAVYKKGVAEEEKEKKRIRDLLFDV